ncbi:hypothetical protein [Nostoc sp. CHAB 5715]|uniref:hypothetical protein n=1 Tax=Nostoc sp. CHAB 5715 TaxID=2780400 RepID=UPI001E39B9B6|nr:hypothetical protein [Nostoc sp. CHAB 5715]MCC5622711.1 hypothetical protein [Nostoc sp. CHAB 5715]
MVSHLWGDSIVVKVFAGFTFRYIGRFFNADLLTTLIPSAYNDFPAKEIAAIAFLLFEYKYFCRKINTINY